MNEIDDDQIIHALESTNAMGLSTSHDFDTYTRNLRIPPSEITSSQNAILNVGSGFGLDFEKEVLRKFPQDHASITSLDSRFLEPTISNGNSTIIKDGKPLQETIQNTDEVMEQLKKEGLNPVGGNAMRLKFDDNSFDLVYSNRLLGYISAISTNGAKQAVMEMVRVVKPGGKVRIHPISQGLRVALEQVQDDKIALDFSKQVIRPAPHAKPDPDSQTLVITKKS